VKNRIAVLDGLRGLLALIVLIHHVAQFAGESALFTPLRFAGTAAVPVFLVVSGYCLALPWAGRLDRSDDWRQFYARRCWRILPLYWFALAFGLAVQVATGYLAPGDVSPLNPNILGPLLLLHDVFGLPVGNDPLWSIAVEFHAYLTMPLLVWGWRRFGIAQTTLAACIGAFVLHGALAPHLIDGQPRAYLCALFALGAASAHLSHSAHPLRPFVVQAGRSPLLAVCVVSFMMMPGIVTYAAALSYASIAVGLWACAFLVAQMEQPHGVLLAPPARVVGEMSYSLYALHWPLLVLASSTLASPALPLLAFARLVLVVVPAVLLVAWMAYKAIERPSMKMGARYAHDSAHDSTHRPASGDAASAAASVAFRARL